MESLSSHLCFPNREEDMATGAISILSIHGRWLLFTCSLSWDNCWNRTAFQAQSRRRGQVLSHSCPSWELILQHPGWHRDLSCKGLVPTLLLRTNQQPWRSRIKAKPKCLNEAIWNQKATQVWAEKWQLQMVATTWRICCHLPPCWLWMYFQLVGPQPTAEPLLKRRI